jgi:uncharacterized protein with FMN-binding domain
VPETSQEQNKSDQKIANSLVAVGIAAMLAVYTAGYTRTRLTGPQNVSHAHTPPQAPQTAASPAPKWKDGSFNGWGNSPHGDIEVTVVIKGGRIRSAVISQCRTRYSCSVINELPPQVAQRQSPEIDYVSGATESTNALYYALIEALAKADLRQESLVGLPPEKLSGKHQSAL